MALNGGDVLTKFKGDTSDIDKKTNNLKTNLGKLGASFSKVAGGIATAYGVIAPVVTSAVSSAVNGAKELEQQIGGTEAVFGEFAKDVQKTANDSFMKMGTSASEYMQTINKLGSILQGSGYTAKESFETSSKVMQRASDVASIMGISIEEAMNAITGASKGNFTMMDNLGVAMNATNLQAYALEKGITKSYKAMSTAEKSALAYQMFLEKTEKYAGNYAKENDTLAGSMNTLKKSWDNFLSGAGDINSVFISLKNAIDVLIPKIVEIVPHLVQGLVQIIQAIIPQLPMIINTLLPAIIEGTQMLIIGLIEALPDLIVALADMLPTLIPVLIDAIMAIIPALIEHIPDFLIAGGKLIGGLIAGIINAIPTLLARVAEIIVKIVEVLRQLPQKAKEAGRALLQGLWNGVKSMKDWVVNKVKDIGNSILNGLKGILGIKSPSKEFAIIGKFSVLGYTEALDDMTKDVQKQVNETFGINPQLASSSALHSSPNVIVNNNISMKQDPLGQMVNDIKTFSGGSKNDYNYGMGV